MLTWKTKGIPQEKIQSYCGRQLSQSLAQSKDEGHIPGSHIF